MRKWKAFAAASFAVLFALLFAVDSFAKTAAPAPAPRLTGHWEGVYRYNAPGQNPVLFTTDIVQDSPKAFTGRVAELNTFGSPDAKYLFANLDGGVEGKRVWFKKTYDGTGGQTHSILYEGTLERATMTVKGQWKGEGSNTFSGTFEMKRGRY
jgi:hypothetical protein